MNCLNTHCQAKGVKECICGNLKLQFCKTHFDEHLTVCNKKHYSQIPQKNINPKAKTLVLNKLQELLQEIKKTKTQLIEYTSKIISSLTESCTKVSIEIDKTSKKLRKFIETISLNEKSLPNCRMKRIIGLSQDEVAKEVKTWDGLYKFTMKSNELGQNIKEYASVYENFDSLFSIEIQPRSNEKNKEEMINLAQNKLVNNDDALLLIFGAFIQPSPLYFNVQEENKKMQKSPSSLACKENKYQESSRPNTRMTAKCPGKHDLKWSNLVPFQYFKYSKSFYIRCDRCSYIFSSSCWNCLPCKYDLCENCGNEMGFKSSKIKCLKNHELIWRPDICLYYEKKRLGFGFTCKSCNSTKTESSWNCRYCNYDLCADCGKKKFNQSPFFYQPTCNEGHTLTAKVMRVIINAGETFIPTCNSCSIQFEGEALICKICRYLLCPECREFHARPAAGHPILSCRRGHLMRWAKASHHKCDICLRNFNIERYRCRECDFDICIDCSDILIDFIIVNKNKKHKENHILQWNYNPTINGSNNIKCSCCKNDFDRAGMFCCNNCTFSHCAPCFQDPKRMKRLDSRKELNRIVF